MSVSGNDNTTPDSARLSRRTRWGVAGAIGLTGTLGIAAFMVLPGASATPSDKVTICHATSSTSNPYTVNTISTSSIDEIGNKYLNGHGDHTGPVYEDGVTSGWGDIIPPFTDAISGVSFSGYNWTTAGQAIWNAGCTYTAPSPSPTPTESTVSPTPTPTDTTGSPTPTPTPTDTTGSPTPTPTDTTGSPTPTTITTSPAPITSSPAPITTSPAPTPTPTETSATPTPTGTSPAPITTSPAPITTSPAPTDSASPSPTAITSPSMDVTLTPPAPATTDNPNPSGGLPNAVPAGGGPGDLPSSKPTWLWLVAAAFLALLITSLRQLAPGRDSR